MAQIHIKYLLRHMSKDDENENTSDLSTANMKRGRKKPFIQKGAASKKDVKQK